MARAHESLGRRARERLTGEDPDGVRAEGRGTLDALSVPPTGTAGTPVAFSASPFDVWSPVSITWSFGDGATGAGAATSHTHSVPGTCQLRATATDATGSPVHAAGGIAIAPRPTTSQSTRPTTTAGGGTNAAARATISRLRLAPTAFRAAGRGASVARKRVPARTRVSYRLSTPATITFTVERRSAGRRVGKRCAKPTKANRRRRACVLYVKVRGSFTRRSPAGANRFSFTGRLQDRRLKPGSYRLVATPPAGGRRGPSVRVAFRIVR